MHRVAVYPGSFDPPTLGHLDIIERASRLYDRVIVAIGVNSSKTPFLDYEQREAALRACTQKLPNIEVDCFEGLLVDYAKSKNAGTIVRGLRAVSDFDYEFQIAVANRQMCPEVETVLLMTKWDYGFISSSVVREVANLGGNYEKFVPPEVAQIIAAKLNR